MSIVQNDTSQIAFDMVDATTGDPATGKTVTGQWRKAGGTIGACAGTFAEIGGGSYGYTPAAGEVNTLGDVVFIPTATGCKTIVRGDRVVAAGAAASDWTSARAGKIDNLDVASSTIVADIAALNDVSAADILAAVIETNGGTQITVKEALQLAAAIPAGTVAGILSGAGSQTFTIKSASGQSFLSVAGDELGNHVVTVTPIT